MGYTNFCCRSGGSNLNAGTRTGSTTEPGTSADLTYASGNWVQSTRVFTVASGDPVADGVAVGDYVSVYPDGSSVAVFIGQVSARTTTTITVHATIQNGTAPADGTGNRTLKVGGAWLGPNGTTSFPMSFVSNTLTVSTGPPVRINLKNDQTYSMTTAATNSTNGVTYQGYTSAYGDLGKATFDAGGNAIVVINSTGSRMTFADIIVTNNGASGTNSGLANSGTGGCVCVRCVAFDIRGTGILGAVLHECEAYACNKSNTSNFGGFNASISAHYCVAHDMVAGTNAHGAVGNGIYDHCIFDTISGSGIVRTGSAQSAAFNCDFYNCAVDGVALGTTNGVGIYQNNNFVKCAGVGVRATSVAFAVLLFNNGFGAGTMANGTNVSGGDVQEVGSVNYASNVTPWVDPDNGDFRISLAAAKNAGRGAFVQTSASYTGAVGYPDIGAAQHVDAGGATGGIFF